MSPSHLLGTTFECECGRRHTIGIRTILYANTALQQLPDILASGCKGRRVQLCADTRTFAVAGHVCADILSAAGWDVVPLIVPDTARGSPVCDDATLAMLKTRLQPCDTLLAVGSGVVSDLTKWLAAETKTPYATVATAASMNGYSSNNIAPSIRGVKCVISGTIPYAIVSTPDLIATAPYELTSAGLGDVLAKPVSNTDWTLNHLLFDDYYCPLCAQLIRDLEPRYMENPARLRDRDPQAVEALFHALLYSGIAMTIAGTSSPASGGEHMISHVLDMTAARDGQPHDLHGRQVGLGTIFACALYERVLQQESPEFDMQDEKTDSAYWKTLSDVVENEHALKRRRVQRAFERLTQPGMWDRLRSTLAPLTRPPADIKRCLRDASAAHGVADIGCSRDRFLAAALHAHQMRERFTIIDLARMTGVLPHAARDILDEYL